MPIRKAISAATPPRPNARPIGVPIIPTELAVKRAYSQNPEIKVARAVSGMTVISRRRCRAAITLPPSGPTSPRAGTRKYVLNAIMPIHRAPDTT